MKQDSILVVLIGDGKRSKSIGHVRPSSKPLDMTELAKVEIRSVRPVRMDLLRRTDEIPSVCHLKTSDDIPIYFE